MASARNLYFELAVGGASGNVGGFKYGRETFRVCADLALRKSSSSFGRAFRPRSLTMANQLAAVTATCLLITSGFACSSTDRPTFGSGDDKNDKSGNGATTGPSFSTDDLGTNDGGTGGGGGGPGAKAAACDDGLSGEAAETYAKAIGICTNAATDGYGLVSAKFTRGYGRTDEPMKEQHNILPKFGDVIRPREGKLLGVLSTGYAQEYNGPGNASFADRPKDWWNARANPGNGTAAPGFPKGAADCRSRSEVNDVASLKLELTAPRTATGIKFDFNFHSGEWPRYVCSPYNDGFVAYLSAKGFNGGIADNMSFDKNNNPVSVNNGFFDRCTPNAEVGCAVDQNPLTKPKVAECPGGPGELAGTGFGIIGYGCAISGPPTTTMGGATGWLTSQAPVERGETFTLEFMIWDTGDGLLDSSVLIDNFEWIGGVPVTTGTDRPK